MPPGAAPGVARPAPRSGPACARRATPTGPLRSRAAAPDSTCSAWPQRPVQVRVAWPSRPWLRVKVIGWPTMASKSRSGLSQRATRVTSKRWLMRSETWNWRTSSRSPEAMVASTRFNAPRGEDVAIRR
ncbi:Hypothetical protein CAP_3298 [Chondromyces apiculatus DSM 436]|uniref:Uncharacterized protein n=1 Tax=Chondromyces apiculatus DSM 436 TaxID=1192034 RepID=A0A017T9S9_9BACT|nr:Hypothetical protein CAP_3298 [Chondromyces apiculatus DSM 436]